MKLKRIFRYDPTQKKLRLFALIWNKGNWGQKDNKGIPKPYSFKLTFAIRPSLFSFNREYDQVRITILGLSFNYHFSACGRFV